MTNARAYLAGLGTSGSLLICLALVFIVASALVAFRGWPHVGAQPSPGEVVVSPQPTASSASAAARRLVLVSATPIPAPATPAGAIVAGAAGGLGGRSAPGTRSSIGAPASTSRRAIAQVTPVPGATPCETGCGPAPAAGSALPVPAPVQQLTQTAQQGLQRATGTLGKVVGGAGGKVGTVVRQTSNAAGGAVQTVSPSAAGVVRNAGSGTANLLGGLTKTAAGVLSNLGGSH